MQIEVSNLTKKFKVKGKRKKLLFHETKEFTAVNNISFEIKRGDIVGFIGPNGAGKSTTIKMLTGIISKSSGSIKINELDPFDDKKVLTYKIGCMFGQKSQLYMHLTVRDSFYLIGSIYDIPKEKLHSKILDITKMFNIEEYLDKTVRKLSLGQRMICEIAACIIHEPEIIFFDEPTIGLDVIAKLRVREIIKKLNDNGVTIILTSHDVSDVSTLCNNIIVINKGKIIENTTMEEIKRKYLTKKNITFYYSSEVGNLNFKYEATKVNGTEIHVEVDTKKEKINDIITYFTSIGEVSDINITSVSMEEIIKNIYERKV